MGGGAAQKQQEEKEKQAARSAGVAGHLHLCPRSFPGCQQEDKDLINSAYASAWLLSKATGEDNKALNERAMQSSILLGRDNIWSDEKGSPSPGSLEFGILYW